METLDQVVEVLLNEAEKGPCLLQHAPTFNGLISSITSSTFSMDSSSTRRSAEKSRSGAGKSSSPPPPCKGSQQQLKCASSTYQRELYSKQDVWVQVAVFHVNGEEQARSDEEGTFKMHVNDLTPDFISSTLIRSV